VQGAAPSWADEQGRLANAHASLRDGVLRGLFGVERSMVSRRKSSAECPASLPWDPLPHNRRYAELLVSLAWRILRVFTLEPFYHPDSYSFGSFLWEAIGRRSAEEGASASTVARCRVVERSYCCLACKISAWSTVLVGNDISLRMIVIKEDRLLRRLDVLIHAKHVRGVVALLELR
jgi:hypothetical protein